MAKDFLGKDIKEYRTTHIMGLSICIIFPLCLLESLSALRYATLLSLASIAYTSLLVIVELPMYWKNATGRLSKVVYFNLDRDFFSAVGITFFSFVSQTSFYAATEKLLKRDTEHLKKVPGIIRPA